MNNGRKTAILTGGLGYIGRHLATHLISQDWEVVLLVRPGSGIVRHSGLAQCQILEYDGTKNSLDRLTLNDVSNVVFFHLAAHVELTDELAGVDRMIDSNIRLGSHLLCHMVEHGLSNIVVAESYWQFDDKGTINGNCIYATSKSAFGLLLEYFSRYDIRSRALVLYDVYGPRDDRGKLVNALIQSAVTQIPLDLTPGEQLLDYVYIDDVVRAFEIAGASLLATSAAVGNFRRYTVRTLEVGCLKDFVEILSHAIGKSPQVTWGKKSYPTHQIFQPWFPSPSVQLPGWHPMYTFFSGIRRIMELMEHG